MEVGELLVALVVVVTIGCSWWSWHYQKMVSGMMQDRPSPLSPTRHGEPALDQSTASVQVHQIEPFDAQPSSSVLRWEAFSIASTLRFEGTVLVSCTRQSDTVSQPGRLSHDGSLVLLIGDDEQASRAYHLIEHWRAARTTLRLRPTKLASAIEVYDRRHNALRADLLAT